MILHENKEAFGQAISAASRYYHTSPDLIEKDYYVTLVLKSLSEKVDGLIFKGGTSLSKCYKIIDRFSEDLDLTLSPEKQSQGQRKKFKYTIVELCAQLGLTLKNQEQTHSRRNYNRYEIEFPIIYPSYKAKHELLVETVFIQKSYPVEKKTVNSLIGEWLAVAGNDSAIKAYDLLPFEVTVQKMDRTFVDKVFAVCDYYMDNKPTRNSRHIYDLYKLSSVINLDENLKLLVKSVREERKKGVKSYSAQDGVNVTAILKEIAESKFYELDYNAVTLALLSKEVPYAEAVTAIDRIIKCGIFDS